MITEIEGNNIEKKNIIFSEIEDILIKVANVKPELVCKENYDEPFSGNVFNLKGRDILYIFYEVESRFKITINVCDILNYEFNSINGISQCIKMLVNSI